MSKFSTKDTPRTRRIVSNPAGNAIQITGIVLGALLLWISAQPLSNGIRESAMIAGYLLIYFTSHSIMHHYVGRLVGIQFNHYSVGGSYHASAYPAPMRIIFERLPFFAAHINPASMKTARPYAKALMFTSGITSTVLFSTGAALIAYRANTPGASALLIFNIIWQVGSLISEMRSSGDLGKAFKAIRIDWQTN